MGKRSCSVSIFAATLGVADVSMSPELYRDPYLVRDIVRYRAAAIATRNVEWLGEDAREQKVKTSSHAVSLRKLALELGVRLRITVGTARTALSLDDDDQADEICDADHRCHSLDDLQGWRGLFSPTGQPYRSLNRTLTHLPGGVPHGLVCALASLQLDRPVLDRAELAVATLFAANQHRCRNQSTARVFVSARRPHIREALRRVAAHTRNDLTFRRTRDLRFLVRFLLDFPEDHRGTLVGLADKAIRWHQHQLGLERSRIRLQYDSDKRLVAPPLPPPAEAKFLETVEEVLAEGERMGHCIASMIPNAVMGYCYLFHVEYEGEFASIMVNRHGHVVEAQGPRNQRNLASARGERLLRAWGRQMAQCLKEDTSGRLSLQPLTEDDIPF